MPGVEDLIDRVPTLYTCISRIPRMKRKETYIDNTVAARHKGRSVRGEVDGEVVQLVDVTKSILRRHGRPNLLLRVESRDTIQGRVHIPRRDTVDPDIMLSPFRRERFPQLDDCRFGCVVTALLLGIIDDGARHGCDEDDRAAVAGCNHGAAACLGHEEGAGDVDVDEAAKLFGVVILGLDVRTE